MENPKCKITVLKRTLNRELVEDCLEEQYSNRGPCELFQESQEFTIAEYDYPPEGFCPHAWADIRHDLFFVAFGGTMPGMKQSNTLVSGCTDWFRPVLFKIEKME